MAFHQVDQPPGRASAWVAGQTVVAWAERIEAWVACRGGIARTAEEAVAGDDVVAVASF